MSNFINKENVNFSNIKWLEECMSCHNGFIAGGCFKNIFNNEKIKDVDIFFENELDFKEAELYYKRNENFIPHYENSKVVAFKEKTKDYHIELIKSVFGTPEQIISDFDFSIVKFAYYNEVTESEIGETVVTQKVVYDKNFFEHLHLKRLVVEKEIKYPISTLERMFKYAKYGYFPCRESKINIINAIRGTHNEVIKISESLYDGVD